MAAGETRRRGIQAVVDEVERRGGRVEVLTGARGPGAHHLVIDSPTGRWRARVKIKSSGTWQDNTDNGAPATAADADDRVWIYVEVQAEPAFSLAPAWWAVNDIHDSHTASLERNGGRRARTAGTTHHAIHPARVRQWRDRWDIVGL